MMAKGKEQVTIWPERQSSFKSLFRGSSRKSEDECCSPNSVVTNESPTAKKKSYMLLSSLANVIVGHCSRYLHISVDDLQKQFESEASDSIKHPSKYARNFLEYCCFKALAVATQTTDHLSDKSFRRLTFDMMIAWEVPSSTSKPLLKIDTENSVGAEAFTRLAPVIPTIADVVTACNLFDVLTASTRGRLTFPIYDKYLGGLEKVSKTLKSYSLSSLQATLSLANGEMIIDVDGTVTTQPVLQHVGISAWPGRLTLTDHALYFEALGLVSYDRAKKYDLSADLKQTVKPELTGPWGARLFDKAVMYKSVSLQEPVVMEFPEITGHSRRDYWLAAIQEVLCAHQFIRKFNLEGVARAEALSKAVLGILRLRAIKEAFHNFSADPGMLLLFNHTDKLPGGDLILEAMADLLPKAPSESTTENLGSSNQNLEGHLHSISSVATLANLGFRLMKGSEIADEASLLVGEVLVGELTPLEKAISQSRDNLKHVAIAEATIDGVRVEGIDRNVAVMKELVFPIIEIFKWLQSLASWEEPLKSATFCIIVPYIIYRGWVGYALPCFFLFAAVFMLISIRFNQGQTISEIKVISPPPQNAVEQILSLREAISQVEEFVQASNIVLLKIRALLLSAYPQATQRAAFVFIFFAALLVCIPLKLLVLCIFLEMFTRQMPLRRPSTERFQRRMKEWWFSIPAAPVLLEKANEDKKRK